MKKILFALSVCVFAVLLTAQDAFPSAEQLKGMIRKDHPRLFLTPETLPAFRVRANTVCKELLEQYRREMDELKNTPDLTGYKGKYGDMADGCIVVRKHVGDQDELCTFIPYCWSHSGGNAVKCAILYLATGEKVYRDKAVECMRILNKACETAHKSRMMFSWYHTRRLAGLLAWDWLYNDLTPAERREFMEAQLKYTRIAAFGPGYMTCGGYGYNWGNYGEKGFLWQLAIAALGEPYQQELIDFLWKDAYRNEIGTLEYREKISAGTGQLVYPAAGYCFGFHPFSSYNFLHTLKSAMGMDGTKYYPQMADYARFFNWMTVPAVMRNGQTGYISHGWGNEDHAANSVPLWMIYTHMAQLIHFFGDADPVRVNEARRVIAGLPPESRNYSKGVLAHYPFLPFILTKFDPSVPAKPDIGKQKLGMFYPSAGLLVVRSGTTIEDTFASVSLGNHMNGPSHYDELAFMIFKKGCLTCSTGTRGNAAHHLAYWPQTISTNAPLIRMPGETLPRHWYPQNGPKTDWSKICCDGGQTKKGVGKHLGITQTDRYVIGAGDGTAAYSEKKCKEAVRQFVYIKPDYFVIYDRLESVKPDQEKVFQIHSMSEPECCGDAWTSEEYQGRLFWRTMLPEKAKQTVIGGPGKEFWTNGRNFPLGKEFDWTKNARNFLGTHRMEVTDPVAGTRVRFLHVLQASPIDETAMIPVKLLRDGTRDGVELVLPTTEKVQVWFNRTGKVHAEVTITGTPKPVVKRAKAALQPGAIPVPNGDLECGMSSWIFYGVDAKFPAASRKIAMTQERKIVHSGRRALRLVDDQTDYGAYTVNPVAIPAGKYKRITIKAWIKGEKGKTARLGLMFHKSDGTRRISQKNVIREFPVTQEWKEYSVTGEVPADSDYVYAMAGAANRIDKGEILVDDVTMTGVEK